MRLDASATRAEQCRAIWRLVVCASIALGWLCCGISLTKAQYSYPLSPAPTNDLFFVDALHGWILGSDGHNAILFRTTNGGNTWTKIGNQPPIYKMFFLTISEGYALAVDWPKPDAPRTSLFNTHDGGQTWSQRSIILKSEPKRPQEISDFLFIDAEHGWFVGQGMTGGVALNTNDGGKSIHPIGSISSSKETLEHICALGKNRLWATGQNILASFDAGKSWKTQFSESGLHLISCQILEDGQGWAVGQGTGALILESTDFGMTWHVVLESKEGNFLTSVSFWDSKHGCAVGASTILYCSSDGGETWEQRRVLPKAVDPIAIKEGINVDNSFSKIILLNGNRGWVLAEGGWLFETDDGGKSWHHFSLEH